MRAVGDNDIRGPVGVRVVRVAEHLAEVTALRVHPLGDLVVAHRVVVRLAQARGLRPRVPQVGQQPVVGHVTHRLHGVRPGLPGERGQSPRDGGEHVRARRAWVRGAQVSVVSGQDGGAVSAEVGGALLVPQPRRVPRDGDVPDRGRRPRRVERLQVGEVHGGLVRGAVGDRQQVKEADPQREVHPRRHAEFLSPFLIERAGDGPAVPAAPYGAGPPGCPPWSGEASRSWCRVAAGGLVGWRVSWVRDWLPVVAGAAPGLAVPRPLGRDGSRSRGARPGGRARVARAPALPRGARSPWVVLAQRGEPVLRSPPRAVSGINDHDGKSRVVSHLHQPLAQLPGGDAGDRAAERPAPPPAGRPAPVPFAALVPGLGEVDVLDHDRAGAVLAGGSDEAADGGAEPPVADGGGQPGQLQRHRERQAEHIPVGRDHSDPKVAGVQVDGHHRVAPQFRQRRDGTGAVFHDPSRYQRPEAGSQLMS